MLKKLFFPLLILIALIGCNQLEKSPKIKTSYYIHRSRIIDSKTDTVFTRGGLTTTNHYGPDGKKDTIFSSDGSITTFNGDNKVTVATTVNNAGNVIRTHTEFLNENGSTDSSLYTKNGNLKLTRKFVYDKDGNNVELRTYAMNPLGQLNLNFVIQYEFKDGNIISEHFRTRATIDTVLMINPIALMLDTVIQKQDAIDNLSHFDFYYDKLNTNHGNSNSKNLVKTKVTLSSKMDTTDIYFYRYTFDEKGRVLTEVDANRSGMEYDSTSYTYY